jgi:tRNA (guanine-N7-)-methyltransferase
MGKDKLRRFAEIETFSNVLQLDEGKPYKGEWSKSFFKNDNPVVLELACGKGEYTVNLAVLFPDKNFIGIDYKGNRIWRGAKTALEDGVNNVAFLRIQIENLEDYFGPGEVDEIWITFPDPQPQLSREKKRLTSPRFLDKYILLLKPGGCVNLKTDNDGLYAYTAEKIAELKLKEHINTADLYHS